MKHGWAVIKEVPSFTALEQMLRRRRDDHIVPEGDEFGLGRKLGEHADIGPTAEDGARSRHRCTCEGGRGVKCQSTSQLASLPWGKYSSKMARTREVLMNAVSVAQSLWRPRTFGQFTVDRTIEGRGDLVCRRHGRQLVDGPAQVLARGSEGRVHVVCERSAPAAGVPTVRKKALMG